MPLIREYDGFSEGDQTWLGSTRGLDKGRTEQLDISAFTIDPELGYIPSGTPVAYSAEPEADDHSKVVPFVGAAVDSTGVLQGFLRNDIPVYPGQTEDANAAVIDHGRIIISRLPVDFEAPAPENTNGNFVFQA